jgi:molybdopterin synthase sulfur carrier subunit
MKIKVVFFAALREQLGISAEEIDLPAGVTTVAGLRSHLVQRGGTWQDVLADKRLVRVAVNQDMAQAGSALKPGDEIAFFPPVTGG